MRLTCTQQILNEAVSAVARAIPTQHALPILNNILLDIHESKLTLTATNLEMAVIKTIPISNSENGSFTVPSKLFSQLVSLLPVGEVHIATTTKNELSVDTDHSHTTIKGVPADDFPSIPKPQNTKELILPSEALLESLNYTLTAAASGDIHPVLASLLLDIQKNTIHIVATDSYRVARFSIPHSSPLEERIIIPIRAAQEMGKIITPGVEETHIQFSTNQAHITHGATTLITRLIEGKYPPYEQIIPTQTTTTTTVQTADIISALRRASIFSSEGARNVQLHISSTNQTLRIISNTEQAGSENVTIPCAITGPDVTIAFNVFYLIEALSRTRGTETSIETTTETSPAIIRPVGSATALHIIMPLKL